ncbi:MAG: pilus assembly PilX N-terminal domain-containing protein [Candidatus Nanoarchaeia archaeon]
MFLKTKKVLNNQSGAALVIALMIMVILTMITLASISTSIFELKLSGNKRGSTDAFYAADSGIQVTVNNINNFNLSGKYDSGTYDPFTDPENPNPTNAKVIITHEADQKGSPRGSGYSASSFDYEYFSINSTGQDQTEVGLVKSTITLEEKIVRLVPTQQGGN